jgi:hypothetical protein
LPLLVDIVYPLQKSTFIASTNYPKFVSSYQKSWPGWHNPPLLYIVLYVVDFVLVLNIKSINNTQGNLKMWPYWTVFRYMQVKLYAIFLMREIRLPFIDRDLLYSNPQQYFSYIMKLSFIGGGSQSTGRKPPTCPMSLTSDIIYWIQLAMSRIRTHNICGDRHWVHR